MQTTLLGLAIALILALLTALIAPLVVDWNQYRGAFETEAGRLTGLTVRVKGTIDARILPTPHIKLHNVEVGAADRPPQMRAASIELELGLGPLLRGQVRTTELRLIAPQISVGLTRDGSIDWPAPSPSAGPDALTISRVKVEDGRVTLADAGSGTHVSLQKLWFDGDIRSLVGPLHGEGAFVAGDELYGYRVSGSPADGGGLKLKLSLDSANHPLTTEIEGALSFDRGVPQFAGTLALSRPVEMALVDGQRVVTDSWELTGNMHATPASASLAEAALRYGPDERAVNLTGKAELTFGANPHLDGTVMARQVDVDRALAAPDVTRQRPLILAKSFLASFIATVKPPLPVVVNLGVDVMTVGGTTIQSLHGNVGFDAKGWSLRDFAFRAPGFTEVNVSGRLEQTPQGLKFSGPARLESADLRILMAWLAGRSGQPEGPPEAFTARGELTIASDRFALEQLAAALDRENVEGRLAYAWATGDRPATLAGELRAATLDIDALSAFAKAALSGNAFEMPHEVALVVDVGKANFAGVDARAINARVKFDAGILHIDRLSVGDLGGAALDISGRIDELSSQPRGRLTLDLDARTLVGLTDILGGLAPDIADTLRPFVDRLAPAKVHGVLTVDRAAGVAGSAAKLDLGGMLGALRLALNGEAAGDAARPAAAAVRVTGRFDADDGSALLRLLGLDRVIAVDQLPGQMTLALNGPLDGDVHVNGVAAAGGFSAAVDGALKLTGGEQAPTGSLRLKASAADLSPLRRSMTGQSIPLVPVSASATVAVAGKDLSATDIVVSAGKSSLRGRLAVKLSNPVGVNGEIDGDKVDAAAVCGLLLGLPITAPGSNAVWSSEPVGVGAFAGLSGAVLLQIRSRGLHAGALCPRSQRRAALAAIRNRARRPRRQPCRRAPARRSDVPPRCRETRLARVCRTGRGQCARAPRRQCPGAGRRRHVEAARRWPWTQP